MWIWMSSVLRRFFPPGRARWHTQSAGAPGVVAEASALLRGRAAGAYACQGRPVPYWAWLNALAHRPPSAFRAVATAYPSKTFTGATIAIADELDNVTHDQALTIQAEVLAPAELEALAHGGGSPGP